MQFPLAWRPISQDDGRAPGGRIGGRLGDKTRFRADDDSEDTNHEDARIRGSSSAGGAPSGTLAVDEDQERTATLLLLDDGTDLPGTQAAAASLAIDDTR